MEETKTLLGLPEELLENILSYCEFDTISSCRPVCKVVNETCQRLLNHGFSKVDKYHARIQKIIKNKLPRRESERRSHPLAKHVNALSAIETRLSLLNMTYMKYIDMQLCCFIPGKVLDEMFRVLGALADVETQPRTHELLQELRDISSMAMEHFDEKIVPTLRAKMPLDVSGVLGALPSCSTPLTPSMSAANDLSYHVVPWTTPTQQLSIRPPAFRQELNSVKATLRATSSSVLSVKKDVSSVKVAEAELQKKVFDLERRLREQSLVVTEQAQRLCEQEQSVRELTATNLEYENKLTEVYREIAGLRAEVGLEASDNIAKALNAQRRRHAQAALHAAAKPATAPDTTNSSGASTDSTCKTLLDSIFDSVDSGLTCNTDVDSTHKNNLKSDSMHHGLKDAKRKRKSGGGESSGKRPVTRAAKKHKI